MEPREYSEDIDFQKYWLILKRRWLPATAVFLLVVMAATATALSKKPVYEAQGRLLFKKKNTTSALVTEAGEKIGELDTLNNLNTPVDTEAQVVSSIPLVQKTIAALNLRNLEGKLLKPEDLLGKLTVKGIKGTDVLQVSFKTGDPKESAAVVNQLMKIYIQHNILSNRAEAAAAREFITQQLPKTEAIVRQAEAALRSFKEKNNIVALDEESKWAVETMAGLDEQISKTQALLDDATARSQALERELGMSPQQALALNSLQGAGVQELLKQLQETQSELAIERTRYQEQHPVITNLKNKEFALNQQLNDRVKQALGFRQPITGQDLQIGKVEEELISRLVNTEVERLGFADQVTSLSRSRFSYQQRANVLPKLQQGLRDLERQVEAAQSTYQILLKNLQDVTIAENQNVGNATVMAYATIPEIAVGPKRKLILAAGIVAGSLLYIVTAFLIDLMDPSIKTAKELRELFKYTWLGMIPYSKKKGFFRWRKLEEIVPQMPVRDAPQSVAAETYRMLQANLKFLSPDKELKVIVVTSSVAQEGKSTVSANLAAAMAQLGRRVLLIDADLHNPMQHHIWDLANAVGLSDVIVNQAEFQMAVREVMEQLDVLPSGVIPPNPLALLDSKRMVGLVEEFREKYDFVILDTPPLVLVADAITLGKMTDGILLVTRPGAIDRVSATASKEFLVRSGQEVLGLVVNGVKVKDEPDSYFHHAKSYCKEEFNSSKIVLSKPGQNNDRF
ncbi:MAG TPA: polysaccharide biosynthesis tyrosine autokinase [Coleofasciculaceae cyanobacterium]